MDDFEVGDIQCAFYIVERFRVLTCLVTHTSLLKRTFFGEVRRSSTFYNAFDGASEHGFAPLVPVTPVHLLMRSYGDGLRTAHWHPRVGSRSG